MTHPSPLRSALLGSRVPRYTSYPPADRFSPNIGPATAADWLAQVAPGDRVSLYAHVPFCRRLCWFCACRTQGTQSDAPLDRYLDHLAIEVPRVRRHLPRDLGLAAVHIGGGTPTILSPDRIARLSTILHDAFEIDGDTEVSVEIDPTECDAARIEALMEFGLTRASIGIQDFDPMIQKAIGREQSFEDTARAVAWLREKGVGSVNADLLYGLPHQTEARMHATLKQVLELAPDRIALYGYAHVPWAARRQKLIPDNALPSPEGRLTLSGLSREILEGAGYVPIGIDHFAKPGDSMAVAAAKGTLRRNFQGYTTDTAEILIGLGPSAISKLPSGYAQNAASTSDWQAALAAGMLGTARGYQLDDRERRIAWLIERLMCDGRLTLTDAPTDVEARERLAGFLAATPDAGTLDGTGFEVVDMAYARLAAYALDDRATSMPDRYSQAV